MHTARTHVDNTAYDAALSPHIGSDTTALAQRWSAMGWDWSTLAGRGRRAGGCGRGQGRCFEGTLDFGLPSSSQWIQPSCN